jgi:hypothetical protein
MLVWSTALPCHHHHAHGRISEVMPGHTCESSAAKEVLSDPDRRAGPRMQAKKSFPVCWIDFMDANVLFEQNRAPGAAHSHAAPLLLRAR